MLGYGYHSDEPVKGKATMHKPTNVDGNKVAVVDGENRQTAAVLLLEEGKYFCTYFHQFRPRFRPGEDEPPTLHYGKGRLFKYCRPELADFTFAVIKRPEDCTRCGFGTWFVVEASTGVKVCDGGDTQAEAISDAFETLLSHGADRLNSTIEYHLHRGVKAPAALEPWRNDRRKVKAELPDRTKPDTVITFQKLGSVHEAVKASIGDAEYDIKRTKVIDNDDKLLCVVNYCLCAKGTVATPKGWRVIDFDTGTRPVSLGEHKSLTPALKQLANVIGKMLHERLPAYRA